MEQHKKAPIFIVDDDFDDRELLEEAWKELEYKNELKFFDNGEDVLNYLKSDPEIPFLIISELTLPKISGFELKRKLLEDDSTNLKSVPFVFLSSSVSKSQIDKAFELCSNGVFIKETHFDDLKQQLIDIIRYWLKSLAP